MVYDPLRNRVAQVLNSFSTESTQKERAGGRELLRRTDTEGNSVGAERRTAIYPTLVDVSLQINVEWLPDQGSNLGPADSQSVSAQSNFTAPSIAYGVRTTSL